MKCDCGKNELKKKEVDYILLGQNLGKYPAMVCDSCNETVFYGEDLEKIEKKAKEKGIWGISAKTRIGTSGNALDVKLPKLIVDFLGIKKGQEVLIEPIDKHRFRVDLLE